MERSSLIIVWLESARETEAHTAVLRPEQP